jgi:hypothetical protein
MFKNLGDLIPPPAHAHHLGLYAVIVSDTHHKLNCTVRIELFNKRYLIVRTSDELLATTSMPDWHVPTLIWNVASGLVIFFSNVCGGNTVRVSCEFMEFGNSPVRVI